MNEFACAFGEGVNLIGVITVPDEALAKNNAPAVILLNSGLLPHTGPFRLHVELARRFAQSGFTTLRFDLSGIGDSEKRKDSRAYKDQIADDLQNAMDFISKEYNIDRFVLMGICTGADNAHKLSVIENRVIGNVCIDGYTYPTFKYYRLKYLPMIFSLQSWATLFTRALQSFGFAKDIEKKEDDRTLGYYWDLPPRDQVEADFRTLIERQVKMFWIYSSSWHYNYTGQLEDAFSNVNFKNLLSISYMATADHTHSFIKCREQLIESINSWMLENFDQEPVEFDRS